MPRELPRDAPRQAAGSPGSKFRSGQRPDPNANDNVTRKPNVVPSKIRCNNRISIDLRGNTQILVDSAVLSNEFDFFLRTILYININWFRAIDSRIADSNYEYITL